MVQNPVISCHITPKPFSTVGAVRETRNNTSNAMAVSTPESDFLKAASGGDLTLLESLTGNDEELTKAFELVTGAYGRNALHLAVVAGKIEICKFLVEKLKFDVDFRDEEGNTPLILAVAQQRQPIAEYLIENGAGIGCRNRNSFTALHFAALKDQKKILPLLLSKGEEVKAVLNSEADPNSAIEFQCSTPLMLSILFKSYECLELLLKAGADPNHCSSGKTPLLVAVFERDMRTIDQLLKAGASPNVVDNTGMTPIERAALSGNVGVVEVLFPFTSQISSIPDWSVDGIMKHVNSMAAMIQRGFSRKHDFHVSKAKGQEALEKKDYEEAIYWYTEAYLANKTDETVLSDRSLCWEMLDQGDIALVDAKACVALKPGWAIAHYRLGAAWKLLNEYSKASEAFSKALKLDPNNKEFKKAQREAKEAEKSMQVSKSMQLSENLKSLRI